MWYLCLTALIWALSITLIGNALTGPDVFFVAAARMGLALGLFLFFLKPQAVDKKTALRLMGIGAVQYAVMAILYLFAFRILKSYEVALFTITTPFWVMLLSDANKRAIRPAFWVAVLLSILGAWLLQPQRELHWGLLKGFLLVQAADFCFAWGQVSYRKLRRAQTELVDSQIYAYVYLGAFVCALIALVLWGDFSQGLSLSPKQWGVLLWLGLISSGLAFFLWNKGAVRTNPGTLAAANNLKIPLAVGLAWCLFGEMPQALGTTQFVLGAALIFIAMALPLFNAKRT